MTIRLTCLRQYMSASLITKTNIKKTHILSQVRGDILGKTKSKCFNGMLPNDYRDTSNTMLLFYLPLTISYAIHMLLCHTIILTSEVKLQFKWLSTILLIERMQ